MPPEKPARRLGRGLDAIFNPLISPASEGPFRQILVSEIHPNPFQPRQTFNDEELKELELSLETNGLLQPITVRTAINRKGYELIAGERRLRAATSLGWKEIPSIVKDLNDQEVLTMALVENLQRSDLDPIEEAEGYERLIEKFGHTQQAVAGMVGKNRSTVANTIRILQLPQEVKQLLQQRKLTAGQARPLLGLTNEDDIRSLARQIVDHGLNARDIERRVRETPAAPSAKRGRPKKQDSRPAEVRSLEQRLRKHFQTDVSITLKAPDRGNLTIAFYSTDDLDRLLELFGLEDNPH